MHGCGCPAGCLAVCRWPQRWGVEAAWRAADRPFAVASCPVTLRDAGVGVGPQHDRRTSCGARQSVPPWRRARQDGVARALFHVSVGLVAPAIQAALTT